MVASFIQSDIKTVLSSKVFGETVKVVWQKYIDESNREDVTIPEAIWDDEDIEAVMGEGVAEIIPQPMVTGATADFIGSNGKLALREGDPMIIRGETLHVKNWKRDGTGVIEIYLSRTGLGNTI